MIKEGNIVVDGVLASCYASINHDVGHIGMLPMRWFPVILQWIFGSENGFSSYAKITEELGRLVLPYGQP